MRSDVGNYLDDVLARIKAAKVLVIGDTILDKYTFVQPKGRAIKDPILSAEYESEEVYMGGVLAIAKHVSTFVDDIQLYTVVGDKMDHVDFINESMPGNINMNYFTRQGSPTTVKQRYIDDYRKIKLFKTEYIDDTPISQDLENQIAGDLIKTLPDQDLVIVGDFGHGFLTERIREVLQEYSQHLSINVQTNSSNMGFNYVTLYKRADFITLNETEMRLPLMMRFESIDNLMKAFACKLKFNNFMLTLGKEGSKYYRNGEFHSADSLTRKAGDTVGAGDASFAISSLFDYGGMEPKMLPLVANCAAAIKMSYIGNKGHVTKDALLAMLGDHIVLE